MMTSVNTKENMVKKMRFIVCTVSQFIWKWIQQSHLLPCELAPLELGFTTRIAMTKLKSNRSIYVRR